MENATTCPPLNPIPGQIFVAHADLTQLSADAIILTTSTRQRWTGNMVGAFKDTFDLEALWHKAIEGGVKLSNIGDTAWLPLDGHTKPLGIMVVACTGVASSETSSLEEQRDRPVKFAIKNAIKELRALGKTYRLLIALPLLRFGKGGDGNNPKLSARHQIAAARNILDEMAQDNLWLSGADVVFVAYTHDHYQVFLEARRLEQQSVHLATRLPDNFDALLHAMRNDECVLFVGAGLSAGTGLKSYFELIKQMASDLGEELGNKDQQSYLDLAQWFREHSPGEMGNLIAHLFGSRNTISRPSLSHYLLLSVAVRYVITTNYDDLLERTLIALRRFPVKVITDAEIAKTGRKDGAFVIKMHGDAIHCKGKDDAEDGIVVSRDDYDQFFTRKPMMASLLEGLLLNKTFLFVGYSLRDPDFRQIYAKIAHTLKQAKQPAFAITFEPLSELAIKQWNNKQVYPISISGETDEEKVFHLVCLLDHIAEKVAGNTHLWLTPRLDSHIVEDHAMLEQTLRNVGEQLCRELAPKRSMSEEHAQRLSRTLIFLTEQGWRHETESLSALWERIAEALQSPEDKNRCLIRALAHAERADVIKRLITRLNAIDLVITN